MNYVTIYKLFHQWKVGKMGQGRGQTIWLMVDLLFSWCQLWQAACVPFCSENTVFFFFFLECHIIWFQQICTNCYSSETAASTGLVLCASATFCVSIGHGSVSVRYFTLQKWEQSSCNHPCALSHSIKRSTAVEGGVTHILCNKRRLGCTWNLSRPDNTLTWEESLSFSICRA